MADNNTTTNRRNPLTVTNFFRSESASGIVLISAVVAAVAIANSPISSSFQAIVHTPLFGKDSFDTIHFVNEVLMSVFFYAVGLELSREFHHRSKGDPLTILAVTGAIGGMIVPALIYLIFTSGTSAASGWAIPTATDIAFPLGMVALLGKRVPKQLRTYLVALAITDDLGAILIIAIFYTCHISMVYLLAALLICIVMVYSRKRIAHPIYYIVSGIVLWLCFVGAGIHPTIAGAISGILTPNSQRSRRFEHRINPSVAFVIAPLFAFVNAGIPVDLHTIGQTIGGSISGGIIFGLVIGKPLGIILAAWLTFLLTKRRLPLSIAKHQILGTAAIAGIGFTLSIFVSHLCFGSDIHLYQEATRAIMFGSLLSGTIGFLILRYGRTN